MKIKYELINGTMEIPDDIFEGLETEDERMGIICDYIHEHFLDNFVFEVIN